MKIATREEIRTIDRSASRDYAIPSLILMENAGQAAFETIQKEVDDYLNRQYTIFCGMGNNGGDGAVLARKLFLAGAYVRIIFLESAKKPSADARTNFEIVKSIGVPYDTIEEEDQLQRIRKILVKTDIIVDAIFGIGFHGNISGLTRPLVQAINSVSSPMNPHPAQVISLDIPSGLYADGGMGDLAISASMTITFGLPKLGFFDFPARDNIGKRVVCPINLPHDLLNHRNIKNNLLQLEDVRRNYRKRNRDSHKGDFGHLLIIGGQNGMAGAVSTAALAALKSGVGLVTVACSLESSAALQSRVPAVMTLPISFDDSESALSALENFIGQRKIDTVLLGNGLGIGNFQTALVEHFIKESEIETLILDADGLNAVSGKKVLQSYLKDCGKNLILTPHIGEMAKIVGRENSFVKQFKHDIATDYAVKFNASIVLKDSVSLIAFPDSQVWFSEFGNTALSKGGSGDILAGSLSALCAMGYRSEIATLTAAYLLGRSAEFYTLKQPEETATPEDILQLFSKTYLELREDIR